jgi:hypothetical protein
MLKRREQFLLQMQVNRPTKSFLFLGFTVQLFRWEKILAQKSKETYMYRISPLNDRYGEHKQTAPQLCYLPKLDSRTCFILQRCDGQIFIWNGSKRKENSTKEAIEFAHLVHELLDNIKKDFIILDEGKETDEFKSTLATVILPDSMKNMMNQSNPYPELEYFDKEIESETPTKIKETFPVVEQEETTSENLKAFLYIYPDWECLTTFDSEDLEDEDQILILSPMNDEKLIYVWLGADADYNPSEIGNRFIQEMKQPEDTEIIVVESGEETDEFWKYFVNG